jgi:hypothetical protein
MPERQHIPMSQREPVGLEGTANSRALRAHNTELVAAGRRKIRKIWARDCEHMLRDFSDDSYIGFKALSALSIEDLGTLRYFLVQIEGANEELLRQQRRYRQHRDSLLVISTVCILISLFFLIRIFVFEPPT